ncbi:MAG: hypothetical protein WA140_09445 [Geobacteraceae bacterium]
MDGSEISGGTGLIRILTDWMNRRSDDRTIKAIVFWLQPRCHASRERAPIINTPGLQPTEIFPLEYILPVVLFLQHTFYRPAAAMQSAVFSVEPMKKLGLTLLLLFVLGLVSFSTWQLYAGNLSAAFSTLPFLLITYLFVIRFRR